jgi:molybdopterin converting factor subunit 1
MSENDSITVQVLFFASARQAANVTETAVILPQQCTCRDLRQSLAQQYPALATLVLDEESITLALNEEYVNANENPMLKNGDVVAIIPPISGG